MKLWNVLVATMVATAIIVTFTGFLSDLTAYNSNINVSAFNSYDIRSTIDSDISTLKNTSESGSVTDENTEQNVYLKMWSGMKNLGGSFIGSYALINTATGHLNLPGVIFWLVTSILAAFFLIKTIGGWLFDR